MVAYTPHDRPQDVTDVLSVLDELVHEMPVQARPSISSSHPLPEGGLLGEFTILAYLGTGGCFHAYRVATHADDTLEYVAKVDGTQNCLKLPADRLLHSAPLTIPTLSEPLM